MTIEQCPSAFLDSQTHRNFSIKCKDLKLTENGLYNDSKPESCFFNPEFPDIRQHHPNFTPGDDFEDYQQDVHDRIRNYEDNSHPLKSRWAA